MAPGVLLVRGDVSRAVAWARRGVVPVRVGELADGWVALVTTGVSASASSPYDDAVGMLLGRPVPLRMRGAIGIAQVTPRLVLTIVPNTLRHTRRWLAWEPGRGVVRVGDLPTATVADLAGVARARERTPETTRVLHDVRGSSPQVLHDAFAALQLPGAALATGDQALDGPDTFAVQPDPRMVTRFARAASEDHRWRREGGE